MNRNENFLNVNSNWLTADRERKRFGVRFPKPAVEFVCAIERANLFTFNCVSFKSIMHIITPTLSVSNNRRALCIYK